MDLGGFRNGGEVHKWMYDRHSLAQGFGIFTGSLRVQASRCQTRAAFRTGLAFQSGHRS